MISPWHHRWDGWLCHRQDEAAAQMPTEPVTAIAMPTEPVTAQWPGGSRVPGGTAATSRQLEGLPDTEYTPSRSGMIKWDSMIRGKKRYSN